MDVITQNDDSSDDSEPPHENSIAGHSRTLVRRSVLIEHSGEYKDDNIGCSFLGSGLNGCNPNFACKCQDSKNSTYACVRQISETENQVFCKWSDDESFEEMYFLDKDPDQLNNTAHLISKEVHRKISVLLRNLQKCRGSRCRDLGNFIV